MATEHPPLLIHNLPFGLSCLGTDRLHDFLVVAVGHEADLLTLGLLGGLESEGARLITHLFFGEMTDRKLSGGQLLLGQVEQEVALILVEIATAE